MLNNPLTKFDLYGLYDADDCGGGTDVGSDNRDFRHEHSDQRDHPFSNSYTHERSDSESGVRYETASNPFSSADFWDDKDFYCREDDDEDRRSGWDTAIDYGLAAVDGVCLASDVYAVYALLFCNPAGILSAVGAKAASMIGRTITKLARSNISGRIKNPIAHQVKNTLHITPKEFFGNQTYAEAEKVLTNKFGSPKGGGEFNKSFYNSKTGRTFNLHHDPSHRSRRPHIDIRKRGLKTDHYKDKPFYLKE